MAWRGASAVPLSRSRTSGVNPLQQDEPPTGLIERGGEPKPSTKAIIGEAWGPATLKL